MPIFANTAGAPDGANGRPGWMTGSWVIVDCGLRIADLIVDSIADLIVDSIADNRRSVTTHSGSGSSLFVSNPQSAIRNPQSQSAIRNPQSAIANPQSPIRNRKSAISIRNPQSTIRNPQ